MSGRQQRVTVGRDETFIVGTDRFGAKLRMKLGDMSWSDVCAALMWVEDIEPDEVVAARLRELIGNVLPKRRPAHLPAAIRRHWPAAVRSWWRGAEEGRRR